MSASVASSLSKALEGRQLSPSKNRVRTPVHLTKGGSSLGFGFNSSTNSSGPTAGGTSMSLSGSARSGSSLSRSSSYNSGAEPSPAHLYATPTGDRRFLSDEYGAVTYTRSVGPSPSRARSRVARTNSGPGTMLGAEGGIKSRVRSKFAFDAKVS